MFSNDLEAVRQTQSDVLLEDLSANPYFKESALESKNKALRTTKKKIVPAVNEVFNSQNTLIQTTRGTLRQFEAVVGDTLSDPALLKKLNAVGENVIAAISALDGKIKALEAMLSKVFDYAQTVRFAAEQDVTHTFALDHAPSSAVTLYINGVRYGERYFAYDPEARSVTWLHTAVAGGFDLDAACEITIIYDYEKEGEEK